MGDTVVFYHSDDIDGDDSKKQMLFISNPIIHSEPAMTLASARHKFGERSGLNMSIEVSSTFTVMELEMKRRMFAGELGPDRNFFIYSRHFNPTVLNLSRLIAALEGTEVAYYTASSMSAISVVMLQLCNNGEQVVASHSLYGRTHALLNHFLPRACNITTSFVDMTDLEMVEGALVEGKTKVLYIESVSNPTLIVANIPELTRVAPERGEVVVVDNTFAPMVILSAPLGVVTS